MLGDTPTSTQVKREKTEKQRSLIHKHIHIHIHTQTHTHRALIYKAVKDNVLFTGPFITHT